MHTRWMIVVFLLFLSMFLTAVLPVSAQALPIIEYFTVDNDALNYPAVENGTEAANFSWRATGLRPGDEMQMHALVGGQWVVIGTGFEPQKTDRLVIAHPLDFILPRYRLSVVDSAGAIVAEQTLELHYAPPNGLPSISMFLTFPGPTSEIPLSAFDAPFHVQWRVINRWFNSNLVFEQVMPDGTIRSAEYDHDVEWQYAYKEGYVHIVYPGDYQDVVLQLRVVNPNDGSTLAQQRLTLHVRNDAAPAPELVSFSVTPQSVNPGDTVTVAWEVRNTDEVFIEYQDGNPNGSCAGNLEQVYEMPASGMMQVKMPDLAYAAPVFRLFADYYIGGDRHNCLSSRTPLSEATVELFDYIGQGLEYFHTDPTVTMFGSTVRLSWSVTDGDSVTITFPILPESSDFRSLSTLPTYAVYSDLPLVGSIDVTLPADAPKDRFEEFFLLYIFEDGGLPPVPDATASVVYRHDQN